MRPTVVVLVGGLLAGLAASAGFLVHRYLNPPPVPVAQAPAPASAGAPEALPRPDFSLPDVEGRMRHVGEWAGKVLVVNFWATWCPPCLEEIPVFNEMQRELGPRGLQFLGVAIDDLENVRAFATEHGMIYPTLHGQLDAIDVGKRLGNRFGALPYTLVLDRGGAIVTTHAGPLDRATLESMVADLL